MSDLFWIIMSWIIAIPLVFSVLMLVVFACALMREDKEASCNNARTE